MTTLTQPLELSLICAPVAAIDRRVLSQAWYSALGFANGTGVREPAQGPEPSVPAPRAAGKLASARASRGDYLHAATAYPGRAPSTSLANARCAADDTRAERRARLPLARGIEHRLLCARSRSRHASVVLGRAEGGRIYLVVHASGSRVRLIAICPRSAQATVARALAEARYLLARRGIRLDAFTKDGASCT